MTDGATEPPTWYGVAKAAQFYGMSPEAARDLPLKWIDAASLIQRYEGERAAMEQRLQEQAAKVR